MDELDELLNLFNRVVKNLYDFTAPADKQIERLKGFAVADEIASDFSDISMKYVKILFENEWITGEQYQDFLNIDKKLHQMSKTNKDIWDENALKNAEEWKECRDMGLEILKSLGY
ncbi:hypothetical protein JZO85_12890 [Enterococcus sp. MJM16]|uniref:Uncharacterized protein n=2 Tax=Enterococcus TaxID=1350 RepID=A0ABS3HI91_9ENTE|nr:hypothetical protein [Enterococcus sp. MJM16]